MSQKPPAAPGMRNLITDVPGLTVGQAQDLAARTGVTVILPDARAVAACDVRGGGPGTRETDALAPENLVDAIDAIVLGKTREVRLTLACVLARGHLLIEDVPGVGKTTLAHAVARVLGLAFQRIQFTLGTLF